MRSVFYELDKPGPKLFGEWQFPCAPDSIKIVLDYYDLCPNEVSCSVAGVENQTLIIRCTDARYVLRVYRQHKKTTYEIESEIDFMQYLAEKGVPVPEVIRNSSGSLITEAVVDGVSWKCIVMSYMSGEPIRYCSKDLLGEIARLQAQIHILGAQYAVLRGILRQQLRNKTSLRLVGSGLTWGFTHFDITRNNVLALDGHISALLDFDDMGFGLVVDCLARSLVPSAGLVATPQERAFYVGQYQAVMPLSALEKLRLRAFIIYGRRIWPKVNLQPSTGSRAVDLSQ